MSEHIEKFQKIVIPQINRIIPGTIATEVLADETVVVRELKNDEDASTPPSEGGTAAEASNTPDSEGKV